MRYCRTLNAAVSSYGHAETLKHAPLILHIEDVQRSLDLTMYLIPKHVRFAD
jgi:hypothetical protein